MDKIGIIQFHKHPFKSNILKAKSQRNAWIISSGRSFHSCHSSQQSNSIMGRSIVEYMPQYKWFIRPADCQRRYESFLKFIDPLQEVNQIIPYKLKNMNYQGCFRTPQSFIFSYRQLKRRQKQNIQRKPTQSAIIYQKKIIYNEFYDKQPDQNFKNGKLFDQNGIVNIVYTLIKQRCSQGTILNEQIVSQKIEQLFFQVIEKTNQCSSQNEQTIDNPLRFIKLFGQHGMKDEKRQIFQFFYLKKQDKHIALNKILRILKEFYLLYSYRNKKMDDSFEGQNEIERTVCVQYGNGCNQQDQSQNIQQKQIPKQEEQIIDRQTNNNQRFEIVNNKQKIIQKGVLIEENNGQYCNNNQLNYLLQPENQIQHFQQIYSQKKNVQVEAQAKRQLTLNSHFSSFFQGIQISIHNNIAIINTPQQQEQVKEQAKLQEIKQQMHQQINPETKQVKKVRRKRYVRRGAVPIKLPLNTKTLIIIND